MDDSEEVQLGFLESMFGRNPMEVPCFRTTFFYSISSYIGVGLLTFLFTSKPALSSHVGMGSFVAVTLGYYSFCRYQFAYQKFNSEKLQELLHKAAVMEGVEEENKLQEA
ncbi:cytochrome c oxidase protein 20 homolog [Copidosoma floridanum]|uniref:cytochrome c oxidase protein 20 homolog n=1 Tax=Copidosoma floridanum TaxID=29053 RepID=UPI0006C9D588|nr:cytochrome c oxidase protein 20 homolog [Copidosoma floridanum]